MQIEPKATSDSRNFWLKVWAGMADGVLESATQHMMLKAGKQTHKLYVKGHGTI